MKKSKPLGLFDYIIFAIIGLVCFLCFQQGDIMHTAGSSYGFLQGHILDYYDWVAYEYDIWDSYMPSTYILFAIWNIPMKLFGIVVHPEEFADFWVIMWYKLLPTLFYLASGLLVYKIGEQVGMGQNKSKLCAYAFITAPIGFFSQFMFGQYDSFTVFFILLGLLYYYKKNHKLFVLFFALAIPFKLWPLLFFVPLLLLREKNIWKIIRDIVLVAIPYAVEFVLFYGNDVFRQYVLGFSATGYVSAAGINANGVTISYVILLWGFICAYAYFKNPEDDAREVQWSLFLCCLVLVALFGLSQWHPQWLLLAMPFFVLSAFINKNTKKFLIIDIFMMLFYVMYVVNGWPNHVDQELFTWGMFGGYIYREIGNILMMRDLYVIKDKEFLLTVFTALLAASAIFKHPHFCEHDFKADVSKCIGWIRARFLVGVGIFVIPAAICFIVALFPPYLAYETGDRHTITGPLVGQTVSQTFVTSVGEIDSLSVMVATYNRKNDVDLEVRIVENDTDKVLQSVVVNAKNFEDNGWAHIKLGKVEVEPGTVYRAEFFSANADVNNCITLYRTEECEEELFGYAQIDGEAQDYNLCFKLFATEKTFKDESGLFGWKLEEKAGN